MTGRAWLHSLVSAAISGGASGFTLIVVAPQTFNFTNEGLKHLGIVCALAAATGVANLLKSSPLPVRQLTVTETTDATVTKSGV